MLTTRALLTSALGAALALVLLAPVGTGPAVARDGAPGTPPGHGRATPTTGEARAALATAKRLWTQPSRERTSRGRLERTDVSLLLRDLAAALPRLDDAEQAQARRILARPTDGAGDQYGEGYTVAEAAPACSTRVCVHYVTSTDDAPALSYGLGFTQPRADGTPDPDGARVPDQVKRTLDTMNHVYAFETGTLGFRTPLSDAGSGGAGNPDGRIDVYLANLGRVGFYGYCSTDAVLRNSYQQSAYCVLDDDFARDEFGAPPVDSLRVTAAHEFFHAVQFAYDTFEDDWLMEGTAVWMEDVVYDSVDDYLQYLPVSAIRAPRRPVDYGLGGEVYSSVVFWKYLSERTGDRNIVRDVWEAAADAPYSLPAVESVLRGRGFDFGDAFAIWGAWNTLPPGTYEERTSYPSPAWWRRYTLSSAVRTTGLRAVRLNHLTNSATMLAPDRQLPTDTRLRLEINAPDLARGSRATLQIRRTSGRVTIVPVRLSASGYASLNLSFSPLAFRSFVVVVTNASTRKRDCDTDQNYTYACGGYGLDDGQVFTVRGHLT